MAKPVYQGKLDGLCSIYSILNASALVAPRYYTVEKQERLFVDLLNYLGEMHQRDQTKQKDKIGTILTEGVGFQRLKSLLAYTKADFDKHNGNNKSYQFQRAFTRNPSRSDRVWNVFKTHLECGNNTAILVGLEFHWTVARKITESQIKLHDSDGMKVINWTNSSIKSNKTQIGEVIYPTQSFLLSIEGK